MAFTTDQPRVCREYGQLTIREPLSVGTIPRMRGIARWPDGVTATMRINPAYAREYGLFVWLAAPGRGQPRVYGECSEATLTMHPISEQPRMSGENFAGYDGPGDIKEQPRVCGEYMTRVARCGG